MKVRRRGKIISTVAATSLAGLSLVSAGALSLHAYWHTLSTQNVSHEADEPNLLSHFSDDDDNYDKEHDSDYSEYSKYVQRPSTSHKEVSGRSAGS